jgi:hypothetical protein
MVAAVDVILKVLVQTYLLGRVFGSLIDEVKFVLLFLL